VDPALVSFVSVCAHVNSVYRLFVLFLVVATFMFVIISQVIG